MGTNVTINLGSNGFDVIVGTIQSNMRGAATDYDSGDQYPAGVKMWNWATNSMVDAAEPSSNLDSFAGMGAGNTFVKDYYANSLAPGRRLLYVNTALGGTGFTTPSTNVNGSSFHWRYNLTDDANNLALRTRDRLQAIMATLPPGSRIVAYLANHGSTDGSNNTPKATFKGYLEEWIGWFRTAMGTPTVPYIMMQMRPSLVINETRHRIIDEAQQEVAADNANFVNVGYTLAPNGAEYNKADTVHFNALGVRTIGHSLYDVFAAM